VENSKNNIPDELLVKYLLGEASEAEQGSVRIWLKESEENKEHFYAFKLIWNKSRDLAVSSTITENEAWDRFSQRTRNTPAAKKIPIHNTSAEKWRWVAAAILLITGAGLIYFVTGNKNVRENTVQSQPAIPINNNAIAASKPQQNEGAKPQISKPVANSNPNNQRNIAYNSKKHVTEHIKKTNPAPASNKELLVNNTETKKISHASLYEDQCIETYKYHGPKYDSNF